MDKQSYVMKIIRLLEEVKRKPGMYIGPPGGIEAFLSGFRGACALFGVETGYDDLYETVLIEHGWGQNTNPKLKMHEGGLNEHAIVQELLSIEIEVWKRRYNLT
jgi:hypothetical protein